MRKKKRRLLERIAVVEEAIDNIYSIKFILQSLGFDVFSFPYTVGYLKAIREFAPKLIVIDMMMPDGAAFDVIHEIKASPLHKVPLLAITADAMHGDEEQVYQAGGQDVLAKPYSVGDLQEKLHKWLGSPEGSDLGV